ncbi:hypothetical protein [Christiangramia echinicola]|uniref:Uncharacterized protein n=1 Tax=Christiangramia echinicola TaxID=279359 RepID=A0A1H1LBV4_9FLAO|nr:hypothetical protein [Christiangramia echinicola]SDR71986.1 hypothetical protein SAMN04488552_0693 [Christiangramia echinicola]
MKKTILIFSSIIITAILSYQITWINYFLILIVFLNIAFLIIVGLISIFKKLRNRIFKIPVLIICLCIVGILASLFHPYEKAIINSNNLSDNLEYAYKTDQKDRKELKSFIGYFSKLEERDSIRLKQIRKIYKQDKLSKPIDKFHAAFVFHHSDNSKDYKIASELAEDAANSEILKNNYTVQWLKKASYDRYMVSIGQPEKYNTQNNLSIDLN